MKTVPSMVARGQDAATVEDSFPLTNMSDIFELVCRERACSVCFTEEQLQIIADSVFKCIPEDIAGESIDQIQKHKTILESLKFLGVDDK